MNEEEIIEKLNKYGPKIALGGIGAIFLGVGVFSSIYTVGTDSVGVVQRFGKYTTTTDPGMHFKLPYGIDKVTNVPIKKIQKLEFGFRTLKAGVDSTYIGVDSINKNQIGKKDLSRLVRSAGLDPNDNTKVLGNQAIEVLRNEYIMLTGDLNMADVQWVVQWQIKDAKDYLFNIRNPIQTIRDGSQSITRQIIGNGSVDEAITIGRSDNENSAKEQLQDLLDEYKTGVHIVGVKMQSTNPPMSVREAFNSVNIAMQQKDKKINEANQAYNEVVPKAKGEAKAKIKMAEGYGIERINEAKGDVAKFNEILIEYKKAPEITRQRLYLEAMRNVLPKVKEIKIIDDKGLEGNILFHSDMKN
ncbi:FtsH protease activity modulator HflK [Nanoarchaeota archaeon]